MKLWIQSMNISGRLLDHTEEDHLLLEVLIGTVEPKYSQRIHSNGNPELIILGLIFMELIMGKFLFILKYFFYIYYFSIAWYSTASTEDAVFIIGGFSNASRIAQYKNGKWTIVGKLEEPRFNTRSITFGGQTMIIDNNDPTVEIWNLEQGKKLTSFKRSPGHSLFGMEMFLVDKNFCN